MISPIVPIWLMTKSIISSEASSGRDYDESYTFLGTSTRKEYLPTYTEIQTNRCLKGGLLHHTSSWVLRKWVIWKMLMDIMPHLCHLEGGRGGGGCLGEQMSYSMKEILFRTPSVHQVNVVAASSCNPLLQCSDIWACHLFLIFEHVIFLACLHWSAVQTSSRINDMLIWALANSMLAKWNQDHLGGSVYRTLTTISYLYHPY